MTVSVVIVNYNTCSFLEACIRSVIEKTEGLEYEIIVVDNNSRDGSAEMVSRLFPEVTLVVSEVNLGFGRANNLGVKSASGEFIFFLNSDTLLVNNAVSILAAFMKSRPDCGICGGNLTDLDGKPIHSYSPSLPSPFSDLSRFYPKSIRLVHGRNWFFNFSEKTLRVGYITGADMMVRRDLFDSLSGFDPVFFMYYEETDFTNRVRLAGFSVYSVPEAKIIHIKGASLEFLTGAKRMVFESKYRYLLKAYGRRSAGIAHLLFTLFCQYKRAALAITGKWDRIKPYTQMILMDSEVYTAETGKKG